MIGYLNGSLHFKGDTHAVVNVQGVGYEVHLAQNALYELGEIGSQVALEIYTHVTESALQLFGFLSTEEKSLFKKIISVSGIGPKTGLAVLSAFSSQELIQHIVSGNLAALSSINGIGKKTAERIVLELKDKFKDRKAFAGTPETQTSGARGDSRMEDALQALLTLGYAEMVARKALQKFTVTEADTVQSLIKKSLGVLAS